MKVGIITHYYNSHNYGGLLQAYALCEILCDNGINAEQICFRFNGESNYCENHKVLSILLNPKAIIRYIFRSIQNRSVIKIQRKRSIRKKKYKDFELSIPHSKTVYDKDDVENANQEYDIFITGSDQIWNLDWFTEAFFLTFVSKNNKKMAYGASIGHSKLSEAQKEVYQKYLSDFDKISVRESSAKTLLEGVLDNKDISVECVVDPTLLLSREQWDKITSKRIIKRNYVLCYLFGNDERSRVLAERYAELNGLMVVTIPHLLDYPEITSSDIGFGDRQLFDISPSDFISLIKYSACVFTNSFHACVFSRLYSVPFFVFDRIESKDMNVRINSFCTLFDCFNSYIDTKEKERMDYICSHNTIAPFETCSFFQERRDFSRNYLIDSIRQLQS